MVTVKGKKRGSMYVWEGTSKHGNFRRSFAVAFYPVHKRIDKGYGWVEFRSAAQSNIGGQVRVTHTVSKAFITVEIGVTLPYGGTASKRFKSRKQSIAAYNSLVKQVKRAKSIAGITGIIKRRKKMVGWR